MATHFLPKGINVMRTSQPTIHKLAQRRSAGGAMSTLPDLTNDKRRVTCKLCLKKLAEHPERYQ